MDIISKKGNLSSDNTNLFLDHVSPRQSPTAILIRKSPNSFSFLPIPAHFWNSCRNQWGNEKYWLNLSFQQFSDALRSSHQNLSWNFECLPFSYALCGPWCNVKGLKRVNNSYRGPDASLREPSICFGNKCPKSMYFVTNFSFLHVSQSNLWFVGELFSKIYSHSSKSTFFVLIDCVPSIFGAVTKVHMMLVDYGWYLP